MLKEKPQKTKKQHCHWLLFNLLFTILLYDQPFFAKILMRCTFHAIFVAVELISPCNDPTHSICWRDSNRYCCWMLFGTVCDYHVHAECQDGALPNCRQASSHTPGRNLEDIRPVHHWREGNLPPGAKCLVCRKSCWSGECLASWKCEWCGLAVSSTSLAHRNQRRRLDFSISDRNSTAAASSITKKKYTGKSYFQKYSQRYLRHTKLRYTRSLVQRFFQNIAA